MEVTSAIANPSAWKVEIIVASSGNIGEMLKADQKELNMKDNKKEREC